MTRYSLRQKLASPKFSYDPNVVELSDVLRILNEAGLDERGSKYPKVFVEKCGRVLVWVKVGKTQKAKVPAAFLLLRPNEASVSRYGWLRLAWY